MADVAWLHLAALLDGEVSGERLQVWNEGFNWNDALAILRPMHPNRKFVEEVPNQGKFLGTVDDALAKSLFAKWSGQQEYTSFEQALKENTEYLE